MKLLMQTAMIFFGTLMAAGLVALGEPGKTDGAILKGAVTQAAAQRDARNNPPWQDLAPERVAVRLR